MRRYAILAPGEFSTDAKTAHGVIAYGSDETVVVIDPTCAGKTVRQVLPHLRSDVPIVANVAEALKFEPNALLVGTAPQGGALPDAWRDQLRAGLRAGIELVSGLHDMLGDDPELAALARANRTTIWDVRRPPAVPLFSGAAYAVEPPVVLMVGNDCAVGKMTVALELAAAAQRRGKRSSFVPTGQTGIMIAGWGIAVDRVISDFASGAAEALVLYAAESKPDIIFVEGQGGINHPAYAQVTLSLMFGSAPDGLILVCDPLRGTVSGFEIPTLPYGESIRLHEALLATVKPARVLGIALNTSGLNEAEARAHIERARSETGLPADDVVRFGADALYAAVAPACTKRLPLRAIPL
ncbi:MAG: DUF1611 domain-containing protein [Candidatus Eremiobacteraeota bacterium]|nr:DUF1611 domain-containing protein [Candidatus Eremiobacteraeota bacterium]